MQIYRKPDFGYTKEEWQTAINQPALIHFTTSFLSIRPWYEGSSHPYANKWKNIHDRSLWKEEGYRTLPNREKREKRAKIYRMLPTSIAVRGAGILHAYIKPLMYKMQ